MIRKHSLKGRQPGQALVEALVVVAAFIPLLLAVPLIAKYQDIRHAAISASRTAAFECSVRPDACEDAATRNAVADDLRRRHFARHDRDLLSADAMPDGAPPAERNRFWVDRRGASLLARASDVDLRLEVGSSDAARGAWGRSRSGGEAIGDEGAGVGNRLEAVAAGPDAFGLDIGHGLATARVQAGVSLDRTLEQWLRKPEGMRLALGGRTAILVDAWNASSGREGDARSFRSRVEQGRRLPDGAEDTFDTLYAPVRELITGPLLAPIEPRGRLFRYHEIDVEIVPEDRLGQP